MSKQDFLDMLEQNQNIIHKVCMIYTGNQEDHEDLFQEIIYQAWKSYNNFKGNSKVSTWLYRVSLYTALSAVKRKKADLQTYRSELEFQGLKDPVPEDINKLYEIIDQLSDLDRAIIVMYLDECSYEEIADIIGFSVNNIGVRINRIKKKLKEKWN